MLLSLSLSVSCLHCFAVCFAISSVYQILGVKCIFLEMKYEKVKFVIVKI